MTKPTINRRGFLKLAGASAATTAILTGCGPASRYVTREPYADMPEYNYNGESTYYATTCRECAAGCGLVVRTFQGRAIKVEGNPYHPVSLGKTCSRGQATIQGLYNPDRVPSPVKQNSQTELSNEKLTWDEAAGIIQQILVDHSPGEIAFLLGDTDDHLFDFWKLVSETLGGSPPVRFRAESMFSGQATLSAAIEQTTGIVALPHFKMSESDLAISFGASFLETWLSPVANTREYAAFRKGNNGKRGFLIHFGPRMSQSAAVADEWYPIKPGTEGAVALALGRLTAELAGQLPDIYTGVDPAHLAEIAGLELGQLVSIAEKISLAEAPLAIPGDHALTQANGIDNALAILSLDQFFLDLGKTGALQLLPPTELGSESGSSPDQIAGLQDKIESGQIKALFISGANPLFEIPKSFGLEQTFKKLDSLISFSPFPDETALAADYIFPAHTGLESWGYQRIRTGADKSTVSGAQPVVVPFFETQSVIDVFLLAVQRTGGDLANAIPFTDEVAFIENQLSALLGKDSQLVQAGDIKTFMAKFQQFGGWWSRDDKLEPVSGKLVQPTPAPVPEDNGKGEFYLHVFMSPILGGRGANKPWLQETPDPTTTVMWNTWVEINPETARELGIHDDDIIKISTPYGEIEAAAYLYPAIRPDTIAIPFGQGHTAYGRYAKDRGANPANLFSSELNPAGDLALGLIKAKIRKTGEHKKLARLESRIGVYGFDDEH